MKKFLLVLIITLFALPCLAEESYRMEYGVYSGGVYAMDVSMNMTFKDDNSYIIITNARSRGILDALYSVKANIMTTGVIIEGSLIPASYSDTLKTVSKKTISRLVYDDKGVATSRTVTRKNKIKTTDLTPLREQAEGSVDYQSMLLKTMLTYEKTGKCETPIKIFGGKKRYELDVFDDGDASIGKDGYSIFNGNARECSAYANDTILDEEDVSWIFIDEDSKKTGEQKPLKLWFTKEYDTLLPILVKLEIGAMGYGKTFMHLKKFEKL